MWSYFLFQIQWKQISNIETFGKLERSSDKFYYFLSKPNLFYNNFVREFVEPNCKNVCSGENSNFILDFLNFCRNFRVIFLGWHHPGDCTITLLSVCPTKQSKMFQHAQLPTTTTTNISILPLKETSFFYFVLMVSTIVKK